jgi:hypothetical protein
MFQKKYIYHEPQKSKHPCRPVTSVVILISCSIYVGIRKWDPELPHNLCYTPLDPLTSFKDRINSTVIVIKTIDSFLQAKSMEIITLHLFLHSTVH